MPIAAVPHYLGQDFQEASPGMRFGMYLKLWGTDERSQQALWSTHDVEYRVAGERREERAFKKENKVAALKDAQPLTRNDKEIQASLVKRQQAAFATVPASQSLRLEAKSIAPFTTGLGNEHPLENGFSFLNPYGLPYLPGSGVKGVLRQAARDLASEEWGESHGWTTEKNLAVKIGKHTLETPLPDALFGLESRDGDTEHLRGALTFWDVIPQIAGNSLAVEIMTPHQSHYYQQKDSPHDSGQPNPISFLTVPANSAFVFLVTCDTALLARHVPHLVQEESWKALLAAAFEHAFEWLGFGAKTAVGYGVLSSEERTRRQATAQRQAEERRQEQQALPWTNARVRFNRQNASLTVEKDDKTAVAIAPKGVELLESLPSDMQKKIRENQFVRVTAYVHESALVRVEAL